MGGKESSIADLQDLGQIEMPEETQKQNQEKGDEQHGERILIVKTLVDIHVTAT